MEKRRAAILKLNEKRSKIESELETIVEVLENMNGRPGLTEPLVDPEGFPRADVDVMEARKLRNRHACLQTDHCKLMKAIELRMANLFSIYEEKGLKDEDQPISAADEGMK